MVWSSYRSIISFDFTSFKILHHLILNVNTLKKRYEGLQARSPSRFSFFLLVSFFLTNIEYLIYCFVLRGRRIEGLAGAKPLYELPRLLRALLGSVFAYGSLGCL